MRISITGTTNQVQNFLAPCFKGETTSGDADRLIDDGRKIIDLIRIAQESLEDIPIQERRDRANKCIEQAITLVYYSHKIP